MHETNKYARAKLVNKPEALAKWKAWKAKWKAFFGLTLIYGLKNCSKLHREISISKIEFPLCKIDFRGRVLDYPITMGKITQSGTEAGKSIADSYITTLPKLELMPFILLPNNINRVIGNHLSRRALLTSPAYCINAHHRILLNMYGTKIDVVNSGINGDQDGCHDWLTYFIIYCSSRSLSLISYPHYCCLLALLLLEYHDCRDFLEVLQVKHFSFI